MPVLRAQDFYTPPPLPADAWQLASAELVIRWYEEKAQRRLPYTDTVLATERWARIDAGRWVAECVCGSAQVVTPDDPRLFCVECLTGWYPVVFPADVAEAEAAVDGTLASEQFWWNPDEPAAPPEAQPIPDPSPTEEAPA